VNTPLKLAAFAVGLAAVFGAAMGVGSAVGPVIPAAEAAGTGHGMAGEAHDEAPATGELPAKGLLVSQDGYTLALDSAAAPAGTATPLSFRILGPDGSAVTAFDESHEKDLHLIVVRRDLSGFQHVHPVLEADGRWRVPVAVTPGSWRVLADFTPSADGENRTLGADLAVPGDFIPAPLPAESRTAEVDGYTVTLIGDLVPGSESALTLRVSRDGLPVTDLQPYLGAHGHLVALRAGDLAYLHVHPDGDPAPGPDISFMATTPSAGTYRLFLDFRHGDVVRTAAFTVSAHEEAGS